MNNYDYLVDTLVALELLKLPTVRSLKKSAQQGDSIVDLALRKKKITQADFYLAKATHFGMRFMPDTETLVEILPRVVALINPVVAWQLRIIPIQVDGATVTAYLNDPEDLNSFDTFCYLVAEDQVLQVVVTELHMEKLLKKYYPSGEREGKKRRFELVGID